MGRPVSPLDLKKFIIQTLDLEGYRPEDLGDDLPLFKGGLGLDSVDALELGIALNRTYGVRVGEGESLQESLGTPGALAEWLNARLAELN